MQYIGLHVKCSL